MKLKNVHLCVSYGVRRKPFGARARMSNDEGRTWGAEIIVRDDGLTGDLGFPRAIVRLDGKVLTTYYFNGPRDEDRTIQGTFWMPPATKATAPISNSGTKFPGNHWPIGTQTMAGADSSDPSAETL